MPVTGVALLFAVWTDGRAACHAVGGGGADETHAGLSGMKLAGGKGHNASDDARRGGQ